MRKVILIVVLVLLCSLIFAQDKKSDIKTGAIKPKTQQELIDSLKIELSKAKEDTNKVNILYGISIYYFQVNPEEGIKFGEEGLNLSKKINWLLGEAKGYNCLGINFMYKSNYPKALEYYHKALEINEELGNKSAIAVNLWNIGIIYEKQSDYNKTLEYYQKVLKINEELGNKSGVALNLSKIGMIFKDKSNYSEALEYYHKSLKINEELGNKMAIANNLGNIGVIYKNQSEYPKALEFCQKALKIYEELGNKSGIANNLGNIGVIYGNQSNFTKALEYTLKAQKLHEELGNKLNLAGNLNNIGLIYSNQSDFTKAIEYYQKSLKINEELGNKTSIAGNLNNIGSIYLKQSDYHKALEYFTKALNFNKETGNKNWIAINLNKIGELFLIQALDSNIEKKQNKNVLLLNQDTNIIKSIEFTQKSIDIFKEIGELNNQSLSFKNLSDAYTIKEEYKKAFEAFKEFKTLQDSIFSLDKQKEFANLESKRDLEIKEKENLLLIQKSENQDLLLSNQALDLLQKQKNVQILENEKELQHLAFLKEQAEKNEKENQLKFAENEKKLQLTKLEVMSKESVQKELEIKAKSLQRNFFIGGVIISLILFLITFIRFREKKKLSEALENQKNIVEEKNEEIYASMAYASTIQHAILPWESTLKNAFSDILIYYKPKDIVSGDSYWFQEVDGIKYLAVIDCTGHGIPGAMLTVIASTALDDAVFGKRLSDTGQILTYMNEKVTEVLNQKLAENKIRDGMEVGLIAFQKDKIQFSGAGRPLYLKNGTMEIIKTDKRGIAGSTDDRDYQFSSIEFEKSKKLMLYLSSDGFADQMNENSKKYSTKRFISLLDSISEKPISEQSEILENEFNNHKGERNQIDDITILGVKI